MREGEKKIAVVVGAGPAGLTAASELIDRTDVHPLLFEATSEVGGISRTVEYKGNRMDIGGHRFFSKSDRIMQWWLNVMPMQSAPSLDEILTGTQLDGAGCTAHNPECDDRVMLLRRRVSRIFFLRKFFDYPISVKYSTFANLGLWRTVKSGAAYLVAQLFKRKEKSLEDFYVNRFGSTLYRLFFEDYTRKVWGKHPSQLGAEWGSQRVKGLSAVGLLKNALLRPFRKSGVAQKDVETSLIENFIYPKYGPGQLWTLVADRIVLSGNPIRKDIVPATPEMKAEACEYYGLDPQKKHIFVVGGSLGSGTLNNAMRSWIKKGCPGGEGIEVIWQCGKYYKEGVYVFMKEARANGIGGKCIVRIQHSDFIKRMDLAYAVADVVISRSGASSVSELCAAEKAVIFVPSPNVAEDHQTHNAMALVNKDAALLVRDGEAQEKLMAEACALIENQEKIALLECNIGKLALRDAAMTIADEVYKIVNRI